MKKSADYPIGTIITLTNCYGAGDIIGKIIAHPGPFSVTIAAGTLRISGSTSLIKDKIHG